MNGRIRALVVSLSLVGSLFAQVQGNAGEYPPQATRGLTVPVGFAARVFAQSSIVPTTLTWGPDTATGLRHGSYLYVGGVAGNPLSCSDCGSVIAISDEGVQRVAASGLQSVLGVSFGPGNTMWVSDNFDNRGRLLALNDTDGDGVFETKRVVLRNIPNGRHQTNGMTFGPDGDVYLANGNATDNGLECGPNMGPVPPVDLPEPLKTIYEETFRNKECATQEVEPWTGSIIRVDPSWTNVDLLNDIRVDADPFYAADGMDDESVLVAEGFRNIYDVDFNPRKANELWTPMNGPDDPSGSEPVYGFEIDNEKIVAIDPETNEPIYGPIIEDAGFPSCLYDGHNNPFPSPSTGHKHEGDPEPSETPNQGVVAAFGPCDDARIAEIMLPRDVLDEGHEGTSGLAFERGSNFPARYDGDLFIAEWGSLWNLNGVPPNPTGHKVVRLDMDASGEVVREQTFMTGVLPIDVTFGPNGFLYVADMTGQIYEVRSVVDPGEQAPVVIEMRSGMFVPQTLTILRGQTVRWLNLESVARDVVGVVAVHPIDPLGSEQPTPTPSQMNSPGPVPPGGSHTYTFTKPGVYQYTSTTGGNTMVGTIVVTTLES